MYTPAARGVPGSPHVLAGSSASGSRVLPGLINCGSVDEYRTRFRAATQFPLHAQELIDKAVTRVGMRRLSIVKDLILAGLTVPLPNWLSYTEYYWESMNQVGGAIETMVPKARGEDQKPDRIGNRIPIYCTTDDFTYTIREIKQSERVDSIPMDTLGIEMATRAVNERIENSFINGSSINSAGLTVPGLLNAPQATSVDFSAGTWTGATGAQMQTDVIRFMDAMRDNKKWGPWRLYIPTNFSTILERPFSVASDKTIRAWLEGMSDGEDGKLTIRVADYLPADTVVMLQMSPEVVSVLVGQEPTAISWTDGPGFEFFHLVMACMIPRISHDYDNQSGIVIGTPA